MPSLPTGRGASHPPNRRSRSGVDAAKLAYMANQIARNLAAKGDEQAVAAIADHIDKFWDPRMKEDLREGGRDQLSPLAARAFARLIGEGP
jgi:formate dehydrogenase subunit delta